MEATIRMIQHHSARYTCNGWHHVTHVYEHCMMTIDHNMMQSGGMTLDLNWIYPVNGQRHLISIVMPQEQDLCLDMYWSPWTRNNGWMDFYMTIDGQFYLEDCLLSWRFELLNGLLYLYWLPGPPFSIVSCGQILRVSWGQILRVLQGQILRVSDTWVKQKDFESPWYMKWSESESFQEQEW